MRRISAGSPLAEHLSVTVGNMRKLPVVVMVLGAGVSCSTQTDSRIAVETNELGIVALETSRYLQSQDPVFELVGYGAADTPLASVRIRTGSIADLSGEDPVGTDITMQVGADKSHTFTRETELIHLGDEVGPAQRFLALPAVASVLRDEAHVVVDEPASEEAYSTVDCPSNVIQTSPTAYQCCFSGRTLFGKADWNITAPTQQAVSRSQNPLGTGCKASNGSSACSGKNCYYGPHAFSKPTFSWSSSNYYLIVSSPTSCAASWAPSTPGPGGLPFSNTVGTLTPNAGCCIDSTGPCGAGFPKACTSCGGGGDAGQGYWAY